MFKKVLLVLVMLLVAAAPAMAVKKGIRNSAHDLSDSSQNGGLYADAGKVDFDRLCAWCHTPHYGRTDTEGPLWNRSFDFDMSTVALYNSATIEDATRDVLDTGNVAYANLLASDAPLCLSCHDGTVTGAADKLMNVPNGQDDPGLGAYDVQTNFLTRTMLQTAQIADDGLDNDHPIGMTLASGGTGIYATSTDAAVKVFTGSKVWCSSCHNVHDNTNAPFLVRNNFQSAICLACHNK